MLGKTKSLTAFLYNFGDALSYPEEKTVGIVILEMLINGPRLLENTASAVQRIIFRAICVRCGVLTKEFHKPNAEVCTASAFVSF